MSAGSMQVERGDVEISNSHAAECLTGARGPAPKEGRGPLVVPRPSWEMGERATATGRIS